MIRCRALALWMAIALLGSMLPTRSASAEPAWCKPRVGAMAAVGGAVVDALAGHLLGGGVAAQAFATGNTVFGPSPTPSSAFTECIAPHLGDPPRSEEPPTGPIIFPGGVPPDGDTSWIYGDPHLMTRDRLRYTFGGAGDYALVAADGVELQARFVRRSPNSPATVPSGLAIRVDGVTVVLMQDRDPELRRRRALIDGEVVDFESGSWFTLPRGYVHRAGDLWRIEIPGVLAVAMEANRTIIELLIADALRPTQGLLGDGDGLASNDLQTTDGTVVDPRDTDLLYGAFLDAWLREGSASLFTEAYDPALDGTVRPEVVRTLGDFSPEERDAAALQCLEAGVLESGPMLECAYDLLVAGDEALLLDHRAASLGTAGSLSAAFVFGPTSASLGTLALGDAVSAGLPGVGAGRLEALTEVDTFDLSFGPGQSGFLRVDAPCSRTSPVRVALSNGAGELFEAGLVCGAAIPLAPGTTGVSVYTAGGSPEDYAFTVVAPALDDLGMLPFNTPVTGSWTSPGEVFGEVPATEVAVSIQPAATMSCLRDWVLQDGAGQELARAPQCVRLDEVTLTGVPPFTLHLEDGFALAAYDFTLERSDLSMPQTVTLTPLGVADPMEQSFELDANQRIYVEDDSEGPTSGRLLLLAPDGREAANWLAGLDAFVEETEPGTWTLRYLPDGNDPLPVRVRVHRVPADEIVDGALGAPAQLTLVAPGQQASVRFVLEAGQRLYADRSPEALVLGVLRLTDPGGAVVAETFLSQQDLIYQGATAGLHTLTWDGAGATTGTIEVGLFAIAGDTQVAITPGDRPILEVTTPGQIAEAVFDLGGAATAQVSATVDPEVILELWGPANTRLRASVGTSPVNIDASATGAGTYTLRLIGRDSGIGSAAVALD